MKVIGVSKKEINRDNEMKKTAEGKRRYYCYESFQGVKGKLNVGLFIRFYTTRNNEEDMHSVWGSNAFWTDECCRNSAGR